MKKFSYQLCKDKFFAFLGHTALVLRDKSGGWNLEGTQIGYHKETKTVPFQGRAIVVENLTPILSPEQREKRKREIEQQLYEVFSKYAPGTEKGA